VRRDQLLVACFLTILGVVFWAIFDEDWIDVFVGGAAVGIGSVVGTTISNRRRERES